MKQCSLKHTDKVIPVISYKGFFIHFTKVKYGLNYDLNRLIF